MTGSEDRYGSVDPPRHGSSSPAEALAATLAFDSVGLGRVTWLGLVVAAIGWGGLIATVLGADTAMKGSRVTAPSHADLVDMEMSLIGSGFGLTVLGGLQSGFGVLNRFFCTVLARSARRESTAAAEGSDGMAPEPERFDEPDVVIDREAASLRARRPYRILADGTVEVETIVGWRRFASMKEAQDFI